LQHNKFENLLCKFLLMIMKEAKQYSDWQGSFTLTEIERKNLSEDTVIWYPQLCPNEKQEPKVCSDKPILFQEFECLEKKPQNKIYYLKQSKWYETWVAKIGLITAFILLLVGILSAVTAFLQLQKEIVNSNKPENKIEEKKSDGQILTKIVDEKIIDNEGNTRILQGEEVSGESKNGKKAKFFIAYLDDSTKWRCGSEYEIQPRRGKKIELPKDVAPKLASIVLENNLPKYANFTNAKGFIAVGLASEYGENIEKDVVLAKDRITTIQDALGKITKKPRFSLNLGKHTPTGKNNCEDDSFQRRIITIAILDMSESMSVNEMKLALENALPSSEGLSFEVGKYSHFELTARQN
jgi:cell division protein FtsL